jgi:hypothetical protein
MSIQIGPGPLKTAWSLLWSLPVGVAWLVMAAVLVVGWGPSAFNKWVIHWNNMVNE